MIGLLEETGYLCVKTENHEFSTIKSVHFNHPLEVNVNKGVIILSI